MNNIVIYPSKIKMFVAAVGSLLFVLLYFYLSNNRETLNPPLLISWVFPIAFYIGVPFFGLCFVYAVYRLLNPRPAVIINDEGIFDNASVLSAGMLKWEEISDVFTYDYMGQPMLGIVPVDAEAVMAHLPYFKRVLVKMNKRLIKVETNKGLMHPPFNIPQNILPISVDELLGKIEERWRA